MPPNLYLGVIFFIWCSFDVYKISHFVLFVNCYLKLILNYLIFISFCDIFDSKPIDETEKG